MDGWQEALIIAAAAALLLGIAWAIIGDARARAPTETTDGQDAARTAREADHHRRKVRAREAGRRAKQARRRNR